MRESKRKTNLPDDGYIPFDLDKIIDCYALKILKILYFNLLS